MHHHIFTLCNCLRIYILPCHFCPTDKKALHVVNVKCDRALQRSTSRRFYVRPFGGHRTRVQVQGCPPVRVVGDEHQTTFALCPSPRPTDCSTAGGLQSSTRNRRICCCFKISRIHVLCPVHFCRKSRVMYKYPRGGSHHWAFCPGIGRPPHFGDVSVSSTPLSLLLFSSLFAPPLSFLVLPSLLLPSLLSSSSSPLLLVFSALSFASSLSSSSPLPKSLSFPLLLSSGSLCSLSSPLLFHDVVECFYSRDHMNETLMLRSWWQDVVIPLLPPK